ncbi:MAG: hypothetical protein WCJ19_05335 [bacterium]
MTQYESIDLNGLSIEEIDLIISKGKLTAREITQLVKLNKLTANEASKAVGKRTFDNLHDTDESKIAQGLLASVTHMNAKQKRRGHKPF